MRSGDDDLRLLISEDIRISLHLT